MPSDTQERVGALPLVLPEPEQRQVWCPIISVDDHALEPPTLFDRLPPEVAEAAPVHQIDELGRPYWSINGAKWPIEGSNASCGRPIGRWREPSIRYEDVRPGIWDPEARLRDMDLNGVWASLNFPSLHWGFTGTRIWSLPDPEVALACIRAYNDWHLEEWCAADRDRFIPCQLPYMRDARIAGDEIRRNAARGFTSVSFSESPESLGLPSINTEYWDPFLQACAETGTVVNLHVGSAGRVRQPSSDSPSPVRVALFPVSGLEAVVEWIFARIPQRFPDIKIVTSEGGASWVPVVIERLRRAHRQRGATDYWRDSDPDPEETLRHNFWFASIEDPTAMRLLDTVGEDRLMVEVDYPHDDSSWPDSQDLFRREMEGVLTERQVAKVCYENAAALYRHPLPSQEWVDRLKAGVPSAVTSGAP